MVKVLTGMEGVWDEWNKLRLEGGDEGNGDEGSGNGQAGGGAGDGTVEVGGSACRREGVGGMDKCSSFQVRVLVVVVMIR